MIVSCLSLYDEVDSEVHLAPSTDGGFPWSDTDFLWMDSSFYPFPPTHSGTLLGC